MNDFRKKIIINIVVQVFLFIILLALDRLTKYLAFKYLSFGKTIILIDGVLELKYLENSGAAFGIFQNRMWLFYILTAVVMILIIAIWLNVCKKLFNYTYSAKNDSSGFSIKTYRDIIFFNYLLSVIAAGAVGNLIDRIQFAYVIDFIYLKFINFPIFNFADIYVTLSAVLLVIFFIFIYKDDGNFSLFGRDKINAEDSN